jgi:hypothetical protein
MNMLPEFPARGLKKQKIEALQNLTTFLILHCNMITVNFSASECSAIRAVKRQITYAQDVLRLWYDLASS